MGVLKKAILGSIKGRLIIETTQEVAEGKLKSPADLDDICRRLIPALRKNVLTGSTLKVSGVKDDDLRQLFKEVLDEVGISYIEGDTKNGDKEV